MDPRHLTGAAVETAALKYLRRRGLRLLTRNFRCRRGEIDLIMRARTQRQDTLVFVEVRYRSNPGYGGAAASISKAKIQKIRQTAALYLQQHPTYAHLPARFDVIAARGRSDDLELTWLQRAFE